MGISGPNYFCPSVHVRLGSFLPTHFGERRRLQGRVRDPLQLTAQCCPETLSHDLYLRVTLRLSCPAASVARFFFLIVSLLFPPRLFLERVLFQTCHFVF